MINRHDVTDVLLRLASAEATSEKRGETTTEQHLRLMAASTPVSAPSILPPPAPVRPVRSHRSRRSS
ncbi:hypothetical protein NKH18_23845 [Streptomyces sp. M10(2022)]